MALNDSRMQICSQSFWFERGFVTYSNAAKMEMLRVKADTLRTHGAVSEEAAGEMAAGALAPSRAQVAVAITGIAGPAGGSAEKPVGTACFAWALKSGAVSAETRLFKAARESVRRQSVIAALQGVLEVLEG